MSERMPQHEQKDTQAQTPAKQPRTTGQRWFDFLIYGPGNFFGTLLLTVLIAVGHQHKFGKANDAIVKGMTKMGMGEKFSDSFIRTFMISWGGTLMVLPIKLAENCKLKVINGINHLTGDRTATEADIADRPKQTWGTLIEGRLAAWAVVWSTFAGAGMFFEKQFFNLEQWAGRAVADMVKKPHRVNNVPEADRQLFHTLLDKWNTSELSAVEKEEFGRVKKIMHNHESMAFTTGKMLALDLFATVASVTILYVTSHLAAKRKFEQMKDEHKNDLPPVTAQPQADKREDAADNTPRTRVSAGELSAERVHDQGEARTHGA